MKRGYTILFTMLVISVLSTLTMGIANVSLKQRQLTRLTADSQTAFYFADGGMECALFYYYQGTLTGTYDCLIPENVGGVANEVTMKETSPASGVYVFNTSMAHTINASDPCFQIETTLDAGGNITKLVSRGYNVCNPNDIRRVERALEVTFQ